MPLLLLLLLLLLPSSSHGSFADATSITYTARAWLLEDGYVRLLQLQTHCLCTACLAA
jgi:hypothetical protein